MRKVISRNNFSSAVGRIGYNCDQRAVDIDTSIKTAIADGTANVPSSDSSSFVDEDIPVGIYVKPLTERAFDPIVTHYNQRLKRAKDDAAAAQASAAQVAAQASAQIVENSQTQS